MNQHSHTPTHEYYILYSRNVNYIFVFSECECELHFHDVTIIVLIYVGVVRYRLRPSLRPKLGGDCTVLQHCVKMSELEVERSPGEPERSQSPPSGK